MFNNVISKLNIHNEDSLSANISVQNFLRVRKYGRSVSNTCIFYLCYLFCTIYTLNQVVYLILYFDFEIFTRYLQFFMLPLGLLKIFFYHKNSKKWENIIENISIMENESSPEDDYTEIVVQYKKYCHFVTYLFNIVAASLISLIILTFWTSNIFFQNSDNVKYIVIYKILLPFDDSTFHGQVMSMILQSVYTVVTTSYVCCWDGLIITLMVFLAGQFRALRQRCVSALNIDNELICLQNIAKCHKHFMDIIQYVFFYFTKCSVLAENLNSGLVLYKPHVKEIEWIFSQITELFTKTGHLFRLVNNCVWIIWDCIKQITPAYL